MKRILALLLASVLLVGIATGCKREKNPSDASSDPSQSQTQEDGSYKDGTYTATYDIAALDRTVDAITVTVSGGEMKIAEYTAKEPPAQADQTASSSQDASSSQASSAQSSSSEDPATERASTEEIVREQLMNILDQYDDSGKNLDAIVPELHAEEHAYRFVRMMRELQAAARKGDTSPIVLGKYADGTYRSTMPGPNDNGWTEYVEITVSGGLVTDVLFDATKDGKKITEDVDANKADPKPADYYPGIAKAFTEAAEDLTKVFPPAGGQIATRSFIKLTTPLLPNMISGGEKSITAPYYMDGTYKAEFKDFDENGWKDYVVIDVIKGVPTLVEYDSIHKDDPKKKRSSNKELGDKMKESTGTYTFKEVEQQLIQNFAKANQDVLKVENVAGATVSTNNFKLLAGEILATIAAEGDTSETLIVERIESVKQS